MSVDGFSIDNIFGEGKTPAPRVRSKKGKKGKKGNNGFDISMPKNKNMDSIMKMQNDSVVQSKSMGIDQPNKKLRINTFNQSVKNAENPLNFGLEIDAGFKQKTRNGNGVRKKNPLDVGLQVGRLGIDSFDTSDNAFSGRVIDEGIGATPKARSFLAGSANLGSDFISQTRGKERTGLQGGGEQDFLKVSGRSFAGVPQILPSGVDQSPTVQGARNRARDKELGKQGFRTQSQQGLNIVGGLEGLASGVGKAGTAITLGERKQRRARQAVEAGLKRGTGQRDRDFNPFRRRESKKIDTAVEEKIDEFSDESDLSEEFASEVAEQESINRFREARRESEAEDIQQEVAREEEREDIRREIQKRKLSAPREQIALTEIDMSKRATAVRAPPEEIKPNINTFEVEKQLLKRKPLSKKFDKDGDGDIDSISSKDSPLSTIFTSDRVKSTRRKETFATKTKSKKKKLKVKKGKK